jgi:DNA-binding NtrC family response regulator
LENILLLEDDPSLLKLYTYGLRYAGYNVTGTTSLQELQALPDLDTYDLCISDLNVGQNSGEQMLRILAQLHQQHRFPVLVISGSIERYASLCAELGLNTLQKPFINSILIETVQKITEEHEHQQLRSG